MESNQFKDGWVRITTEEYRNLLIDADKNASFPESNVNLKRRLDKYKEELIETKQRLNDEIYRRSVCEVELSFLREYRENNHKKHWYHFFK